MTVRPKKFLGQHFLTDQEIARRITDSLLPVKGVNRVLEIGPGMGVLTKFLLEEPGIDLKMIEIDRESISYLNENYPQAVPRIISGDFLKVSPDKLFNGPFSIIGNFPYNISSQILFRMLEYKQLIPQLVGMFQKEVGMRVCSPPNNKDYGILSVLIQTFYKTEYLFTIDEHVFHPPPKVKSAVIRLIRKEEFVADFSEKNLFTVVKTAFNQRRKTLRNALRPLIGDRIQTEEFPYLSLRAENLGFEQFIELTGLIYK
jgi:16S rRNA (adenine1518-N6/adenine1519-N6)-dimethyltransferase